MLSLKLNTWLVLGPFWLLLKGAISGLILISLNWPHLKKDFYHSRWYSTKLFQLGLYFSSVLNWYLIQNTETSVGTESLEKQIPQVNSKALLIDGFSQTLIITIPDELASIPTLSLFWSNLTLYNGAGSLFLAEIVQWYSTFFKDSG